MTADGELVQTGKARKSDFCATMLVKEGTLKAGEYIVMLQVGWTGSVDHPDFMKVLGDIYCTKEL